MDHSECPLCKADGELFYSDQRNRFFSCTHCFGLFRDPGDYLDREGERERYLHHRNSMDDLGYRSFAEPVLQAVQREFDSDSVGLDYGCGHTPVISEILRQEKFEVDVYDPLFYPGRVFEAKSYDYVICCEVIEHFHRPDLEFELLYRVLEKNGKLICMTALFREGMDFGKWYYKNDPTHVFIYRKETLEYIRSKLNFKDLKIEDRLIEFSK